MAKSKKRDEQKKAQGGPQRFGDAWRWRSRYALKHPQNTSPAGMYEIREVE